MDAPVIAALFTALASLAVAVANSVTGRSRETRLSTLEHEFRLAESRSERAAQAEEVLEHYRRPLLAAAFDLQERLDNILNPKRDFLSRYGEIGNPRRDDAVKTTLYRIGGYFCWVEMMRHDRQFLQLREPEETRALTELVRRVGWTFGDDRYGPDFMLWHEEQRAIGERMIVRDGETMGCVGYATFVESYPESFARWFDRFEGALVRETAMKSRRLGELRDALRSLVESLDPDELRYERWWQRPPKADA